MTTLYDTSDASWIYRETSALEIIKLDGSADNDSLMTRMRNATMPLDPPLFSLDGKNSGTADYQPPLRSKLYPPHSGG